VTSVSDEILSFATEERMHDRFYRKNNKGTKTVANRPTAPKRPMDFAAQAL
jgi:hypothetical protein